MTPNTIRELSFDQWRFVSGGAVTMLGSSLQKTFETSGRKSFSTLQGFPIVGDFDGDDI